MTLKQWAQKHEVDIKIATAISDLSQGNASEMERIWTDPTDDEIISIAVGVGGQGLDVLDLPWGESNLRDMYCDLIMRTHQD